MPLQCVVAHHGIFTCLALSPEGDILVTGYSLYIDIPHYTYQSNNFHTRVIHTTKTQLWLYSSTDCCVMVFKVTLEEPSRERYVIMISINSNSNLNNGRFCG